MTRAILIILSALLFTLSAEASVTGTLRGKVTDASTGEPIAGVIVRACGRFTSTDREGRFSIAPSAGCDSVTFRLMGYATLRLPLSADLSAVALDPKVTSLEFVSRSVQENFILARNEDYYGKAAGLDKVTYKIYEDNNALFTALDSGALDLVAHLTSDPSSICLTRSGSRNQL